MQRLQAVEKLHSSPQREIPAPDLGLSLSGRRDERRRDDDDDATQCNETKETA
jgi:hypothetical protein